MIAQARVRTSMEASRWSTTAHLPDSDVDAAGTGAAATGLGPITRDDGVGVLGEDWDSKSVLYSVLDVFLMISS